MAVDEFLNCRLQRIRVEWRSQMVSGDVVVDRGLRTKFAVEDHSRLHLGYRICVFKTGRQFQTIFRRHQAERAQQFQTSFGFKMLREFVNSGILKQRL